MDLQEKNEDYLCSMCFSDASDMNIVLNKTYKILFISNKIIKCGYHKNGKTSRAQNEPASGGVSSNNELVGAHERRVDEE